VSQARTPVDTKNVTGEFEIVLEDASDRVLSQGGAVSDYGTVRALDGVPGAERSRSITRW